MDVGVDRALGSVGRWECMALAHPQQGDDRPYVICGRGSDCSCRWRGEWNRDGLEDVSAQSDAGPTDHHVRGCGHDAGE